MAREQFSTQTCRTDARVKQFLCEYPILLGAVPANGVRIVVLIYRGSVVKERDRINIMSNANDIGYDSPKFICPTSGIRIGALNLASTLNAFFSRSAAITSLLRVGLAVPEREAP